MPLYKWHLTYTGVSQMLCSFMRVVILGVALFFCWLSACSRVTSRLILWQDRHRSAAVIRSTVQLRNVFPSKWDFCIAAPNFSTRRGKTRMLQSV